jgi:hypothetical protein
MISCQPETVEKSFNVNRDPKDKGVVRKIKSREEIRFAYRIENYFGVTKGLPLEPSN